MIKIIISVVLIFASIFICIKLSIPAISGFKFKNSQDITLKQNAVKYKKQLVALNKIKNADIALKKRRMSTYMFTLLSFVNYLKSKGFILDITISKPAKKASGKISFKAKPANIKQSPAINTDKIDGFKQYEANTKFTGVQKIQVTMKFVNSEYLDTDSILSIMKKLYIIFPIQYTSLRMNKQFAVISFNLYSFKGVK